MPPGTNRAHAGPSVDCVRRPLVYPCTRGERLVVHFTTEYARQSMALLTAFRGPTPSHAHSPCGRIGTFPLWAYRHSNSSSRLLSQQDGHGYRPESAGIALRDA